MRALRHEPADPTKVSFDAGVKRQQFLFAKSVEIGGGDDD